MLECLLSMCLSTTTPLTTGPVLGDLTPTQVRVWCRTDGPANVEVVATPADGAAAVTATMQTMADSDFTANVQLEGLRPGTRYTYAINGRTDSDWWIDVPPIHAESARLAFGSCAKEAEGSGRVWRRMASLAPSAVVLLGDTPYIDTTDLNTQRSRYRAFWEFPPFARLATHTPVYSTWDDHDFGLNDTDGRMKDKANSRRAVTEYRPLPSHGEHGAGIYTRFRSGPVEVWLLDARWFARTAGEGQHFTLLGDAQWAWLERTFKASDAPFRVLACGMVFNESVRPGKTDCWGMYPYEQIRLRSLIEDVPGVVLVSGDVHWSRVYEHDADAAWPLVEFVTSPVHEHLIAAADPPHPNVTWSRGEVNSFLLLDAAGDTLRLSFMNAAGEVMHNRAFTLPTVTPHPEW